MKILNYHPELIKTMMKGVTVGTIAANLLAPLVVFSILYNVINNDNLIIWISLHFFLLYLRIHNSKYALKELKSKSNISSNTLLLSLIYTAFSSLLYGIIIWTCVLSNIDVTKLLIITILILSLSAGSITTLGSIFHAFILYVSFMVFPLIGALLFHGGEIFNILSFILFVFILIHISSGYRQYITLRNAVSLEDSFSTIFNQTSDGIVLIKDNRFKDCNDVIVNMFRSKSKEEFLNTPIKLLSPSHQADGTLSIRKMVKMLNIAWKNGVNNYEWIHTTLDGNTFWTEVLLTKINLNGENLIYGVWRDISQRKEIEQKLEKLNETLERRVSQQILEVTKKTALFETIFDTNKDGIAILDLESNFLLVNKAYELLTGLNKEELYITSCINLTKSSMVERSKEVVQTVINEGYFNDYEKQCIVHNGRIIDIKMNLVLMPDKKSILMITKDMTLENQLVAQRKDQESKLLQHSKLAQMGEMISMIAHQWRQPLGAISSTAVNLKLELEKFDLTSNDGIKDATLYFQDKLNDIEGFVENLTTTIDDFRNFYKPDKKAELLHIDNSIQKALKIVENSLITDNIILKKTYTANKEVCLFDNEVVQVLLNILKNAQDNFRVKKMSNKTLSIKTYNTNKGINLEIWDNGGGIEEETLGNIFDPYFSTKHEKNGTGLGLYMSKMIIEEHHNGVLSAKNIDDGVCFTIEFPDRIL